MKDTKNVELTASELDYLKVCYKQYYHQAYKNFEDYLKIALEGKKRTGTVYE